MTNQVSNIANKQVPESILAAIKNAANKTGVDFSFLVEKAGAESNFNPDIKAKTSSATGLFQFIESTWLGMVKKHGAKHGLEQYAQHIENKNGKLCINNCDVKNRVLEMRKDPKIASLMAAEFSSDNQKYLKENTNGKVGETELYFAHFMGAKGATEFLNNKDQNGTRIASNLFTKEARANKNVFFDKNTGKARSLNEVYDFFADKFEDKNINFKRETDPSRNVASYTHATKGFTSVPVQKTPIPHTLTFAQVLSVSNDRDDFGFSKIIDAQRIYAQSLMTMAQNHVYNRLPTT